MTRKSPMPIEASAGWRTALLTEAKRKGIHLTGLSVPTSILLLGRDITIVLIGLALVAALFLEKRRLQGRITMPSVREHERSRVAGYIYYISGAFLAVILFSPMIAATAMLMLSLGDAASGMIGSVVRGSSVRSDVMEGKRRRFKPAPVVGGTFLVCALVGYASSGLTDLASQVYLAGAIGATVADAVPLSFRRMVVDDNFTIPLLSGALMTLATLV